MESGPEARPCPLARKRGGVSYGKGALAYLLRNRCYVGEILHRGQIHAADHEPIIDRETFEAVQASLAAHAITRKASTQGLGLPADRPSVRQRRQPDDALPQPQEGCPLPVLCLPGDPAVPQRSGRGGIPGARPRNRGPDRAVCPATGPGPAWGCPGHDRGPDSPDHRPDELYRCGAGRPAEPSAGGDPAANQRRWSICPGPESRSGRPKGPSAPRPRPQTLLHAGQAVLAAIGRARRWVDEIMAGGTVAEIARREGKGERQIRLLMPLAFTPPDILRGLVDGNVSVVPATEMARTVPLAWQ